MAVVNEDAAPRTVVLRMAGARPAGMLEYRYFESERPVDERGYPCVSTAHPDADLGAGVTVHLPAMGVVFLTTASPPDEPPTPR